MTSQEQNDLLKLLVTVTILTVLFMFCTSCSSRKTQKSNVKELVKVEETTKVNTDIETKTETQTVINDESQEIEITPIDSSKVLIINGKIYKNAKVKILHKNTATKIDAKEVIKDKTKSETKAITDVKKQTKVKDTEKKSNLFTPLLWLLIPIGGYLIWKYKYKLIGL